MTQPSDAVAKEALATELHSFQDARHPMSYRLRKSTPRLTSTRELYETQDGIVARLIAINDKPLSQQDKQKEQERLDQLLSDPARQRHRMQAQQGDTERALKVLRVLPNAFIYQFAETAEAPGGSVEKFTFRPNPSFNPPDLETQVLAAMSGEIWIDANQQRVTHLEGHLEQDVDVGWGIIARLNKGGWILIEQADVGDHQWRITHFKMNMSGRVVFRNKNFDTTEDQSQFVPLPVGLTYRDAIGIMRKNEDTSVRNSR